VGEGERPDLQPGVTQAEPVGLDGHRLLGEEQRHDRVERLLHHAALGVGVDAHHVGVGRQLAGPAPEHRPSPREVVEQHHAVREHERVVVGQRADARPQPDVAGALGGHGDEHLGRCHQLEPAGVVLADPRLVEPQAVEQLDHLEVVLEAQGRVVGHRVERRDEHARAQRPVHAAGT
jgi:hypothetical protein